MRDVNEGAWPCAESPEAPALRLATARRKDDVMQMRGRALVARAPPPPFRPRTRWYVHQPPPHSQAGSVLLWVPTPPVFTLARLSPLPPQIMWAGTPSKDFLVAGDQDLIPGLGSSSGEGNCNPLQYSCLVIPFLDREARQATVRGVAKSWTRLSDSHTQTPSNVRNQLGNYSTSK